MKKKLLQDSLIVLLGLIPLYILLPIGDYHSGTVIGLYSLFFETIFVITCLVVIIAHAVKKNFALKILMTLIILTSSYIFILYQENNKFWTTKKLEAVTGESHVIAKLILYDNKTFTVSILDVENSFNYQGNYKINNDTLYLMRKDLKELTNNNITNKYFIRDEQLIPPSKKFVDLVIQNQQ